MKTLYILLILLVGCRKSNFKCLELKQKGRISPLLNYLIEDTDTLNNFIEELKLSKAHKEKITYILESKEFELNGSNILHRAAKEDDCDIIRAYYNYQGNIFDIKPIKHRKLVFKLIDTMIENKSPKCFELLINIIKNYSQIEYLDINEIFNMILDSNIKSTYKYINLKKEYIAIKQARKSTVDIAIAPKPVIDFNILTPIGLGIGYISIGLSKSCENMSMRTLLLVGGTALFTTPIYNYWKKFNRHKREVIIKQESIDNITARLDLKKSSLLKIKDETEESELFMIEYLINNININLDEHILKKLEDVEKKKISEYLKNKLSNKKE